MEKDRESRGETPFAICQELLSCYYRVAVARSHIKQINLVRGSVCLRPSGFQNLPPPSSTARFALSSCLAANLRTTLLLFYLNSSSKWERSRGYRGFKKKGLLELARQCFINPLERPSDWLSAILLAAARVSCSLLYKSKYHEPDRESNLARLIWLLI